MLASEPLAHLADTNRFHIVATSHVETTAQFSITLTATFCPRTMTAVLSALTKAQALLSRFLYENKAWEVEACHNYRRVV